jgi:hypothetical protein
MIEMKCPSCGAAGRIPPYKLNVRLICKKCLKPFYISSSRHAVPGDPPIAKDAPKGMRSGEKSGFEKSEAIDAMASKISRLKLPQVSPATLGVILLVGLLVGGLYWFFSRQTLETRSETVAKTFMTGDIKTVTELCVPGTENDAIMWYGSVARKYNLLKMALAGEDPAVTVQPQGDTRGASALVIATFSRQGTRIASPAFMESLQPVPSLSNSNQTMELPLFWVKDMWGDWLLDGKRTGVGTVPN